MRMSDWSSDVCSSDLVGGASGRVFAKKFGKNPVFIFARKIDGFDFHANQIGHAGGVQPILTGGAIFGIIIVQIGRASRRERVCQYVKLSVVAVSLKINNKSSMNNNSTKT